VSSLLLNTTSWELGWQPVPAAVRWCALKTTADLHGSGLAPSDGCECSLSTPAAAWCLPVDSLSLGLPFSGPPGANPQKNCRQKFCTNRAISDAGSPTVTQMERDRDQDRAKVKLKRAGFVKT
jgi:hypothetical protein